MVERREEPLNASAEDAGSLSWLHVEHGVPVILQLIGPGSVSIPSVNLMALDTRLLSCCARSRS